MSKTTTTPATTTTVEILDAKAAATAAATPATSPEAATRDEQYAKLIERSENYTMYGDGITPPVKITYIGNYNGRNIYNFACKTERSVGGPRAHETKGRVPANAELGQPDDWKVRYAVGQYVCLEIKNGYVNKMYPPTLMQSQKISINKQDVAATERANTVTSAAGHKVDTTTGEVLGAAALASQDTDNDLPF